MATLLCKARLSQQVALWQVLPTQKFSLIVLACHTSQSCAEEQPKEYAIYFAVETFDFFRQGLSDDRWGLNMSEPIVMVYLSVGGLNMSEPIVMVYLRDVFQPPVFVTDALKWKKIALTWSLV